MEASSHETLFEIPATLEKPRRTFKLVRGETAPPVDDPEAIEAGDLRGSEWDPQSFEELDELIAERSALAVHHRKVAEARIADAERYEQQIQGLLRKFEYLVPPPLNGKKWKTTVGSISGGSYRFQPERATQYSVTDKDVARDAGLTTTYEVLKVDLEAVREYEREHGTEIPGIKRVVPSAVSFKGIK